MSDGVYTIQIEGKCPYGFRIRGGADFGQRITIIKLVTGSKAEKAGLQIGDEILKINDVELSGVYHSVVTNLVNGTFDLNASVSSSGSKSEDSKSSKDLKIHDSVEMSDTVLETKHVQAETPVETSHTYPEGESEYDKQIVIRESECSTEQPLLVVGESVYQEKGVEQSYPSLERENEQVETCQTCSEIDPEYENGLVVCECECSTEPESENCVVVCESECSKEQKLLASVECANQEEITEQSETLVETCKTCPETEQECENQVFAQESECSTEQPLTVSVESDYQEKTVESSHPVLGTEDERFDESQTSPEIELEREGGGRVDCEVESSTESECESRFVACGVECSLEPESENGLDACEVECSLEPESENGLVVCEFEGSSEQELIESVESVDQEEITEQSPSARETENEQSETPDETCQTCPETEQEYENQLVVQESKCSTDQPLLESFENVDQEKLVENSPPVLGTDNEQVDESQASDEIEQEGENGLVVCESEYSVDGPQTSSIESVEQEDKDEVIQVGCRSEQETTPAMS
ncbi:PDZ and LIM domain protein 5 [Thelohanellus kitauei]|uniref:PDZ and LIM domain protein 5 n=1 Tax=Thelohanellus kitauei TaxID=669202 RepID=A0A0C2MEX9_THEKT|nr:PDZ and LIM domain protein 5 [Thelohanellus kitauei]